MFFLALFVFIIYISRIKLVLRVLQKIKPKGNISKLITKQNIINEFYYF